jgi:transcription elongation factor S-II
VEEEETEVVDAADEAEEEEADEEEEEEEEEEEAGEEGDAEAEVAPAIPRPLQKKKPRRALTAAAAQAGAAQVYSSYLYVPREQELVEEDFKAAYSVPALPGARQAIHKTIASLFAGYLTAPEQNMFERCIYNGAIRAASQRHVGKLWTHKPFVELYSRYAKHIAANFHPKSYVGNTDLYDRYKAGEITFKDISEMDTYQLFEARWTDSFNQQQIREKRQLEGNKAMATDRFLCRCGKRECTYYEMQTRSADEPMTIFITCLNCGKHWRQ